MSKMKNMIGILSRREQRLAATSVHRVLCYCIAVFVLALSAASAASAYSLPRPSLPFPSSPYCPAPSEDSKLRTLINNYRAQFGIPGLKWSIALTSAAKWMSGDMASHNYLSHYDTLGRNPYARMAAFGYICPTCGGGAGETIYAGNSSAQAVFDWWRTSPVHNQIMLDPRYRVIGIGRAYSATSTYGWYWTADFGVADDGIYDFCPF